MSEKELMKKFSKIRIKEANGIPCEEEYAEVFEELGEVYKQYEEQPKLTTSIAFIGSDEQRLEFFKKRLSDNYSLLDADFFKNRPDVYDNFLIAYEDFSVTIGQLSHYALGDENDDPFFIEHDKVFEICMNMQLDDAKICRERVQIAYDYIYKFIPYILENARIDNLPFVNTLAFIMDGAFSTLDAYYEGLF